MGRRQRRSRPGLWLAVAILAGPGRPQHRPDLRRHRHDPAQSGFAPPDRDGVESGRRRQDGVAAVSLPVSVLRRGRQIVVPAVSAFGGRVSRRTLQHRFLCVADDDGGAGDGPQARRLRSLVVRHAPLFEPPRAGAAATDAPDPRAADNEDQSGGKGYLCVSLRRLRARRLRSAPAHQGRGRGVSDGMSLAIRRARPDEAGLVLSLVRELAKYEKLLHEVEASEADIDAALFGDNPRLFCEIAEWENEPAGFAVWFLNFSTFSGRSGIYLEDLFVGPAQRGKGIGKALLAHLASECVANGWSRLQWSVLDWNTPSIEFYKSLGAVLMDEWTVCRIGGPALAALAQGAR